VNNPSNAYFVWEVEGKTVSILVNLDAIDRLESAIARDPNIHGILYGRVDQIPGKRCILVIERLEHYKDLQRIGYYRTVHKPELSIGEMDLAPLRRYLTDPASVLLLIRPAQQAPATAGFFVWENGTMEQSPSYREFPLNRKSLEQQQVPMLQFAGTRDTSVIEAVRDPEPAAQPKRTVLALHPWMWAPVAAVLVLLLILTITHRKTAPAANAPAPGVAQFGQPPSLDLNAQRTGEAIRVSWNRSNPTVVDAERGVLWIKDGQTEQRLELDSRQLTTGTVMYWPSSSDVNFRLEVFSVSKFASESLRAYLGPPQSKPSSKEPAPAVTVPSPSPETQAALQTRARTKDVEQPVPTLAAQPAEPPPPALDVAAVVASKPPLEKKENAPAISISIEPMDESGLRKQVQTVAGAKGLQQEKGGRFTPAKAIQKVTPKLPASLKNNISGEIPVDLKVSIDEEGNIFRTEVLRGKADNRLLTLASDAAKRWRFEPARLNSKPVSSQVLLHFMFRNPT
jgi:outer membrane biosynthesis protein TonB